VVVDPPADASTWRRLVGPREPAYDTPVNRATPRLGIACLALAAASFLPASAQMGLTPQVLQIDQLKCSELASVTPERRDRLLIYFNGYVDGIRRHTVWDEVAVGAMIDRAVDYCRANPAETILSAFTRASR
jgi:HdeA/HdeB family